MFSLPFTLSSWWVHVVVISLICTDGDRLEKEMRCIYQVKETDIRGGGFQTWDGPRLAGEKTRPGNIRQTGWFGEVNI
jgi:hypothetical protein